MSRPPSRLTGHSRLALLAALALAPAGLTACSGEADQPQESTEIAVTDSGAAPADGPEMPASIPGPGSDADIPEIPVTDELGSFDGRVWGLSLWMHPTRPYNSAVIAANGPGGLIQIGVEQTTPDTVAGDFTGGVAVAYPSWGNSSASVIAAYDASAGGNGYRFFDIGFDDFGFSEWPAQLDAELPGDPAALCLVRGGGDGLVLAAVSEEGSVSLADISLTGEDTLAVTGREGPGIEDAVSCAGNDIGQSLYFQTSNGELIEYAADGRVETVADLPQETVGAIAVTLQEGQGQVLTGIRGKPSVFAAYDLDGGAEIGRFTIGPLIEIEGVGELSVFAAEGGNFGGIYRGGIIVTVDGGTQRFLKLAPLSAALRLWELDAPEALNRRRIGIVADEGEDPEALEFEITRPEGLPAGD